jgi:hypothetical protein
VGIYRLLQEQGEEKLAELCRKCSKGNLYGIDYLKAYLEGEEAAEEEVTDQEPINLVGLPNQQEVDRDMGVYERLVRGGDS